MALIRIIVRKSGFVATLFACLHAPCSHAAEFAERCEQLSREAKIAVEFQDRAVVADDSLNIQKLNEMSAKPAGSAIHTLGLTHAQPTYQLSVAVRAIADGQGQICATPEITLTLGFSAFVVYLARDLTDFCRREVIRAHEQEHVNTWRSNLRASAQMLPGILRREIGDARVYATRAEAEADVRERAKELVTPWMQRVMAAASEAQQAIDTPTSYASVAGRLRACPPLARGAR